jgi:hypothetical protein
MMMGSMRPEGSDPWFVRQRSRWSYRLRPSSPAGWISLIVYTLLELGGSLAIFGRYDKDNAPGIVAWVLWATFFFSVMAVFLVLAFRHSEARGPEGATTKRRRRDLK